eukprot:scaffold18901_cov121-Isochrysis_galbana.AAC.5
MTRASYPGAGENGWAAGMRRGGTLCAAPDDVTGTLNLPVAHSHLPAEDVIGINRTCRQAGCRYRARRRVHGDGDGVWPPQTRARGPKAAAANFTSVVRSTPR